MNIRVDLNTPIKDGTEVVFRSPVDCSQVTGLIVYYNGESKEFAFADAHGNNVGDIDHLFAENVVVKVILDVTTSMAFVQNADTNAYLEWRFKDTIDKLCPTFTESGTTVTCEPVEGYPLEVTAEDGATIYRCGKNLVKPSEYVRDSQATTLDGDVFTTTFTNSAAYLNHNWTGKAKKHSPGTYTVTFVPVSAGACATINVMSAVTDGTRLFQKLDAREGNGTSLTFTAKEQFYVLLGGSSTKDNRGTHSYKLQLEVGTTATAYEPHKSVETISLGEQILAWVGVNTLWADEGDITVKGKADPTAIINKLTNAILSLGGNV